MVVYFGDVASRGGAAPLFASPQLSEDFFHSDYKDTNDYLSVNHLIKSLSSIYDYP